MVWIDIKQSDADREDAEAMNDQEGEGAPLKNED